MVAEVLILGLADRAPAPGVTGQEAVDHRIGVAANGRGEVRIVIEHEAVVTDVVRAVTGLHHGAQGHELHDILLLLALHVGEETVQALRHLRLTALRAELIAELGDKAAQLLELLGVGHVVDAIDENLGLLVPGHTAYLFGHTAVGQEHKLLDQLVGVLGHLDVGRDGVALFVNLEAHFGAVETDGAVLEAAFAQLLGQAVERDELFDILALKGSALGQGFGVLAGQGQVGGRGFAVALQYGLHLLVSKAAVRANHGMGQVPVEHVAATVHVENRRVGQLLLIGPQRADEVAQALGQHRDGAVHEVDARGPLLRLAVNDVALLHVVGDVRNMDADFPAILAHGADGEGVVKVLGVVRVDGKGRDRPKVLAPRNLFGRDTGLQLLGRGLDALRVGIGQAVLGQDGVHLGIVLALTAQDVDHLSDRALRVFGPVRNLDHCLVARLPAFQLVLRYEDVRRQGAPFRHEEAEALLHLEAAHEGVFLPLQNLDDFRLARMA